MAYQAPNDLQFVTSRSDCRSSEDLARETASNDSGMDAEPSTPTAGPSSRPPPYEQQQGVAAMMHQMHEHTTQQHINKMQTALQEQQNQINKLQTALHQSNTTNTGMAQLASLLQSQSLQCTLEKEDNRIKRLTQFHWRDYVPRLVGRDNYTRWRQSILLDAHFIEAKDILVHEITQPPEDPIEQTRWAVKSRLLHTRILETLSTDIQEQMQLQEILCPVHLWRRLNLMYGLSPAEERLVNVKTLINLRPQGNPIAMLRQWEALTNIMKARGYTASDIYHDIAIILIADWQKPYVRGQLDDFFARSRKMNVNQLDIHTLIDRLEVRSPVEMGPYKPLKYITYRQDQRNDSKGARSRESNDRGNNTPKGGRSKSRPPQAP